MSRLLTPSEIREIPFYKRTHDKVLPYALCQAQDTKSVKTRDKEWVEWLEPLIHKVGTLAYEIRCDWSDPRDELREIGGILSEIREALKRGIDEQK